MKRIAEEQKAISTMEEVLAYEQEVRMYYWWLNRPHIKTILSLIKKLLPTREKLVLLDMGCGPGRIPIEIARRTDKRVQVYAVDLSENMLKVALKKAKNQGVEDKIIFRQADATSLDFEDNFFDLISCANMLHHQQEPIYLLKEVKRLVKKDGLVVIRDLIRPPSALVVNLFVGVFGLFYDKIMKKDYRQSLYAAFTLKEYQKMLHACGMKGAKFYSAFPHFVTIIWRPEQ